MATAQDFYNNELAGFGQDPAAYYALQAIGAGQVAKWHSAIERKATLGAAALAWTAINQTSHAGAQPVKAPVSPRKLLIARGLARCRVGLVPTVQIWDVVGYANFTTTTAPGAQAFTGFSLPRWTSGEGLRFFVLIRSAVGAATPTITVTYTNTAAVGARTSTATGITGAVQYQIGHDDPFMQLAAGDTGVLSIASIALSASWLAGTACLMLGKPLCTIPIDAVNKTSPPFEFLGNGAPWLLDSSNCYLVPNYIPDAAATPTLETQLHLIEG